jgi:hypothetical protein
VTRAIHVGEVTATRATCVRMRCLANGMASSCLECAEPAVPFLRMVNRWGRRTSITPWRPTSAMSVVTAVSGGLQTAIVVAACGASAMVRATATPAVWTKTAGTTITTVCRRTTTDAVKIEVTNPEKGSSLPLGRLFPSP